MRMHVTKSHDVRRRRGQDPLPDATMEDLRNLPGATDHGTRGESPRRPVNNHTGGDTGVGQLPLR